MDNQVLKEMVRKILEDAFVVSIGVVDEQGPWVADVTYVHDDQFNIYWVSMPQTRHSKAIEKSGKAAATITASWTPGEERSIQIEGHAQRVDGPLFEYEKKLRAKRGKPLPQTPGEVTADGHEWYVLKPVRIELIHNQPFGYERQTVQL